MSVKTEMEARVNVDRAKLVQNRDITDDKLDQNEELAELRADTSLEKQKWLIKTDFNLLE